MTARLSLSLLVALALPLAGCLVGPDYQRPAAIVPASYKEEGWKLAAPADAIDRGAWWSVYRDAVLDDLERQVEVSNQNLKAAEAAYRQARAVVGEGIAGLFPVLSLDGSATRSGFGAGGRGFAVRSGGAQNQFSLSAGASWELDVWGRIRRTVESDVATAQASAADLASARLSAQATLAADYFSLRAAEELARILTASVDGFTQSLQITRNQFAAGVASAADVAQAQTQLENTRSQLVATGVQRAQLEHAIAVLIGKAPGDFAIAPAPFATAVPIAPTDLPSALLERRPDIASAERRMAAANAQIGVAEAAFYPSITLSGSYGFESAALHNLLRAAHKVWSFGPSLSETLFNGGLFAAQLTAAKANYEGTVASYRQTVLVAFEQVEDQLSTLRVLAQQSAVQDLAVKSAREAERLILNQYKAGTVSYTSVITAQTARLSNEQTALNVMQNRFVASVNLIQALGGGWDASTLPPPAEVKEAATAEEEGPLSALGATFKTFFGKVGW